MCIDHILIQEVLPKIEHTQIFWFKCSHKLKFERGEQQNKGYLLEYLSKRKFNSHRMKVTLSVYFQDKLYE